MTTPITASMLYNLVACPHRVAMDLFGDPARRDAPNTFVELLWERGSLYERHVIQDLQAPFLDLSGLSGDEREVRTAEAMAEATPLIYQGRIRADNLLGDPDLLRREGAYYVAGDIKSGAGEEGPDENKMPKPHYAVQLGLYTDILERSGRSGGRRAFVWDVHGEEVPYDFAALYGKRNPRTLWDDYQAALREAEAIVAGSPTLPAYSAACKLCHWYSACKESLRESGDLTTIPELGRSKRDVMLPRIRTVEEFAGMDPESLIEGTKSVFPGIGADSLRRFHTRAELLAAPGARPLLLSPVSFPAHDCELFFDVEVDPMRDVCYLHGFVERRNRDDGTETFIYAAAESATPQAERDAFARALELIEARRPCAIYHYSKYERTIYRRLQEKYPDLCSAEHVEALFDPAHAIDLYSDVVRKATEWPVWDYSIKTLAQHLGFSWRDTHPSGAASIRWFHEWLAGGDSALMQRILDYNEDDCRAMRVLKDAVEAMN